MEWFAELVYSFKCPECGQRIPEGHPKEYLHQQGNPARYSGKKTVANAATLVEMLSSKPETSTRSKADPLKKADAVAGSALVFPSA